MTAKSVFYAWQSWRSPETTRNVIETALKKALQQLASSGGEPVLLDRDTKGVPGAPHIPATIRDKIGEATAFVADLAPVCRLQIRGQDHDVPNPNVMVETGLAVSEHGWESTVLVLNAALGDVRLLPFDLDRHRILQYELAEQAGGESDDDFKLRRKAARDKLTGDLVAAVGAVLAQGMGDYVLIDLCGTLYRGTVEQVVGEEWTCRLTAPLKARDMDVVSLRRDLEAATDRYISITKPGIARELSSLPDIRRDGTAVVATVRVRPELPRESAHSIGRDLDLEKLGAGSDGLTPGGVADIPRRLKQTLSIKKGEWFLDGSIGSLVASYSSDFDYALLPKLIALEIARLAFIPTGNRKEVLLGFVKKVVSVTLPKTRPPGKWLDVTMVLDVEGVGEWTGTVPVFNHSAAETK